MPETRVHQIDLLRFVSALMVMAYHFAYPGLPGAIAALPYPETLWLARFGYQGVSLFFMISGFVIIMSASGGDWRGFVASRIGRLYPAFWVGCGISALVLAAQGKAPGAAVVLANLTMLPGALGVPALDSVYWTLAVEVQFYALVVLVLACGALARLEALLLGWLLLCLLDQALDVPLLRLLFITQHGAHFIAGALYFRVRALGMNPARAAMLVLAWASGLGRSVVALPPADSGWAAVLVVALLLTGFHLALLAVALRRSGRLETRPWPLAGALTYPVYLLHNVLGWAVLEWGHGLVNPHLLFWAVVLGVLALAWAVHAAVERRFAGPMRAAALRVLRRFPPRLAAGMGMGNRG